MPNGDCELNIPGTISRKIHTAFSDDPEAACRVTLRAGATLPSLSEAEHDLLLDSLECVFSGAQQSVVRTLSTDSLPRFRRSVIYRKFVLERQDVVGMVEAFLGTEFDSMKGSENANESHHIRHANNDDHDDDDDMSKPLNA